MGDLAKQKGLLLCTRRCFDNLEVERRAWVISQVLGSGNDQEGADLRVVDRAFFDSNDGQGIT